MDFNSSYKRRKKPHCNICGLRLTLCKKNSRLAKGKIVEYKNPLFPYFNTYEYVKCLYPHCGNCTGTRYSKEFIDVVNLLTLKFGHTYSNIRKVRITITANPVLDRTQEFDFVCEDQMKFPMSTNDLHSILILMISNMIRSTPGDIIVRSITMECVPDTVNEILWQSDASFM